MCLVSSEGWATKPFQNSLIWSISRSGLAFLPMHYSGYGCKWRRKFCTIALEQQRSLEQAGTKVEICGGASETFFEQMVLVLLDLPWLCCKNWLRTNELYQLARLKQLLRKFERAYSVRALTSPFLTPMTCPLRSIFIASNLFNVRVRCVERVKSHPRLGQSFDKSMVRLDPIIEVFVLA